MELFKTKPVATPATLNSGEGEVALSGLTVIKLQFISVLLVALVVLAAAYATYILYAQQVEEKQLLRQQLVATQVAATLQARIDQIRGNAYRLVADEGILSRLQALPAATITLPDELEVELRLVLPALIRALLINPELQRPTTYVTPPLGFACIDLARHKPGQLELHQFATNAQHIDITLPIPAGEVAAARVLILTLEAEMLEGWVKELTPTGSYVELIQQVSGTQPLLIASAGDATLITRQFQESVLPVQADSLSLRLRHDHLLTTNQQQRLIYLSGFAIQLLVITLILVSMSYVLRSILRQDMATLLDKVKNVDGPRQHMTAPVKLQLFRRAMARVDQLLAANSGDISAKEQEGWDDELAASGLSALLPEVGITDPEEPVKSPTSHKQARNTP